MYRFIIRSSIFLIISLLIAETIVLVCIKLKPDYFLGAPVDYFICSFQYSQIDKSTPYTNIVIGDSRGIASLNPVEMGENWTNLSIPGSDFVEGYVTLKKHLAKKNRIDTVVMVYGLNYIAGQSHFFNIRTIPFQFISLNELKGIESLEKEYRSEFQGTQNANWGELRLHQLNRRLKYIHFPFSYNEGFLDGLHNLIYGQKQTDFEIEKIEKQLKTNSGQLNFEISNSRNLNSLGKCNYYFNPSPIGLKYLDSILSLTSKSNIKTFLIIPPINQASYSVYKNSTYEISVNQFFKNINFRYPKLMLINEPISLQNSLFADSIHLNKNGSVIFTRIIRSTIAKH
jgi:hypothetical protein